MDKYEKKSCDFAEESYLHGSQLCLGDMCMRCNDGQWENQDTSEQE